VWFSAGRFDIIMCRNGIIRLMAAAGALGALTANLVGNAAETLPGEAGIVPKPVKLEMGTGGFPLLPQCKILCEKRLPGAKAAAEYLADTWRKVMRLPFPVQEAGELKRGSILLTTAGAEPFLGKEGYRLEVTPEGVIIQAPQATGLFYGVQSLRQLLPAETFGSSKVPTDEPFIIPSVRVEDYPRFGWRGMHLDVSRHFFDVQFVRRYLDHLALHKINVFHWHLTDDDGWRVQIKKYPKLTEVGAWRGPKEALPPAYESGNQRYGGFYTQAQIRDLVRYAADRHILIVPEVDVPAHSRAAIVAYPELLCAGDPYRFKSAQDVSGNVLCPSQELTYQFLEGVLGELADLFPGPYIHVGGDERPKGPWEQCERCQKRMQAEHLADGRFLQDRFLKRLQGFLRTRGKTMVGWDELEQESALDKDYIVMAWQSVEAGLAAARKGYPVMMAPSPFTYFDLAYTEEKAEPGQRWAGVVSVEKAYSFDPKPADLAPDVARRILGVEGCLWSEMLVTPDRPDYMAYPRVCALAEVAWTPQSERSWPDFWARLWQKHLARLDAAGIAYRLPPPTARQNGSKVTIVLPYEGAQVRYTFDGSEPGPNSTLYTQPFDLPNNGVLKMRTFRPNGRGSRTITGA
jgi:hexosaminidase